ncbi:hypothetical protein LOD99_9144 [Oopsacas minuta]|uniref:Integrase zinc-binding domain-containing protein n=1 Tax=Oopsacas minuta TaxID=111878 RepID=A0AAV7JDK6_9METZ|nr:hypothetical protein LOD99_9144 [Oopsacas minuta]
MQLQEFDFVIEYRKGSENTNADALSRIPQVEISTNVGTEFADDIDLENGRQAQNQDLPKNQVKQLLSKIAQIDSASNIPKCFSRIWKQLTLENGLLFRTYRINGFEERRTVIFVPTKLMNFFLHKNHDIPGSGHFGWQKTFEGLKIMHFGLEWHEMLDNFADHVTNV